MLVVEPMVKRLRATEVEAAKSEKREAGVEVPMPIEPAKYAFPVVVAPPAIVRPPPWEPPPMVEEARAYMPLVKPMRVEVELAGVEPKSGTAVKGKVVLMHAFPMA